MSGGVDSSVAAWLLREAGHEVIGVFMRHGEQSISACSLDGSRAASPLLPVLDTRADHKQGCCSASDAEDARRVADNLEIPFYALNLQAEFRGIIDYFVNEYSIGRTPNPCVMCNNQIKFGKLFDYADSVNAEFVATGHYARLVQAGNECHLLRGVDGRKDQSYVLFGIERHLLPRMLLPVGTFEKPKIREMAAHVGLNVAEKKDSQEICFVNSGHHGDFVRARKGADQESTAGRIVTTDGKTVGEHPGIENFTIGQRKKLGVAMGEPFFVTRIDPISNDVVIGRKEDLGQSQLTASKTNWLTDVPGESFACSAQIRYNSQPVPAMATLLPDQRLQIKFDMPQSGVAPGQAVVVFDGERVLGGGWIDSF